MANEVRTLLKDLRSVLGQPVGADAFRVDENTKTIDAIHATWQRTRQSGLPPAAVQPLASKLNGRWSRSWATAACFAIRQPLGELMPSWMLEALPMRVQLFRRLRPCSAWRRHESAVQARRNPGRLCAWTLLHPAVWLDRRATGTLGKQYGVPASPRA